LKFDSNNALISLSELMAHSTDHEERSLSCCISDGDGGVWLFRIHGGVLRRAFCTYIVHFQRDDSAKAASSQGS